MEGKGLREGRLHIVEGKSWKKINHQEVQVFNRIRQNKEKLCGVGGR